MSGLIILKSNNVNTAILSKLANSPHKWVKINDLIELSANLEKGYLQRYIPPPLPLFYPSKSLQWGGGLIMIHKVLLLLNEELYQENTVSK